MHAAKFHELDEKLRTEIRKIEKKARPNMRLVREQNETQIRLSPTVIVRKKQSLFA